MTVVLGLDLGQNVGWFKGGAVGPCTFGTFRMKNTTDLGLWLRGSDEFFREVLVGVDAVAIEQPFFSRDYYAVRKLISLVGYACMWSSTMGIPAARIAEIPVPTAKLTLAGSGRAEKSDMIAAAADRGYPGLNEHESDAFAVWTVSVFGKREPIAKRRTTNGKPVRVAP